MARKTGRLSDAQLAKLAKEHAEINTRIKNLDAKKNKRQEKIIKELQRRGTKAIETHGVRVSMSTNTYVNYDPDGLREALPRPKLRLIMTEIVDKKKLAQAVQDGKINLTKVNEHATVSESKPWINVSFSDE